NAGPWGELVHPSVVHLRVAELIPGHAGDAGGREVECYPQEGRGDQREAWVAGCSAKEHKAEAEEPEVETEDEAESDEEQDRRSGRHIAVMHHGVADPIA